MHLGAIIVCGGKSSRMGRPKALLPFGDEMMLTRVLRIVRVAIDGPIVVVAAPGQELPPLPADVLLSHDRHENRGPLEGLHVGLSALAETMNRCEAAFATGCDVPLLKPEVVRYVCEQLGDFDVAVPRSDGFFHPLAAVYRISAVLPHVADLLAADKLRPAFLFDRVQTCVLEEAELRAIDPRLESLRNLNTPDDYQAALRDAGLSPP